MRVVHLWRDTWTALSGPLSVLSERVTSRESHTHTQVQCERDTPRKSRMHAWTHGLCKVTPVILHGASSYMGLYPQTRTHGPTGA